MAGEDEMQARAVMVEMGPMADPVATVLCALALISAREETAEGVAMLDRAAEAVEAGTAETAATEDPLTCHFHLATPGFPLPIEVGFSARAVTQVQEVTQEVQVQADSREPVARVLRATKAPQMDNLGHQAVRGIAERLA